MKKTLLLLALAAVLFSCEDNSSSYIENDKIFIMETNKWEITDIKPSDPELSPLYTFSFSLSSEYFLFTNDTIWQYFTYDDKNNKFYAGKYNDNNLLFYQREYDYVSWSPEVLTIKSNDAIIYFTTIR